MLKVLLFGALEPLTGTAEVLLDVPDGTNVLNVLAGLSVRFGRRFRDVVFGDGGENEGAIVLVNGAPVRFGLMEKRLYDGDTLSLMPLYEEARE